MASRLTVTDIAKRFGRRWLFRYLSFQLSSGESLAVTGPNGSGKTTLLRLIAGVLTPTDGSVELSVDGRPVDDEARIFHLGYVAPYVQMYDGLTLRENLRFIQSVRGLDATAGTVEDAISGVGLGGREDDLVATFSSGMKQRARLAVMPIVDPELLILDEPTSNLDDSGTDVVHDIIKRAVEAGKMVIIATNSAMERDWCARTLDIPTVTKTPQTT